MIKVGLDLGHSKISCVVCDIKMNEKPRVLSFVSIPTSNINKGTFVDYFKIKKEIKELIEIAAKDSQTEIKSVNLNIPLSSSNSSYYNSRIFIDNELINHLHVKKAINQSEFFNVINDKKTLMNYILNYEIDDKIIYNNPIGNYANELNINFYKLLINTNIFNTYKNLFKDLKIHIANFVPTPLASALATLNSDEKDLGSICIDLGDSSTSIAIFENDVPIFCDSINIGSRNITNDIARGVSTTKESAERLKTLYGTVLTSPSDEFEIIEVPISSFDNNQFKQINRSTINSIIKPRVEETLELIWQKLKQYGFHKKRIKNLVLTGGGSQLEGIAEYAQIIFDSNVRLGGPIGVSGISKEYAGPQFVQTIGCALFLETKYEIRFIKKMQNKSENSLFSQFSSWLDQYI